MRRFVVFIGCAFALLATATTAAANQKPTTGTRIHLLVDPPTTFAAGAPFYVEAGFRCRLGDAACLSVQISARSYFVLEINGVRQPSTVDVDRWDDGTISKLELSNFADGLAAGTYTFTGTWFRDGSAWYTRSVTIEFV